MGGDFPDRKAHRPDDCCAPDPPSRRRLLVEEVSRRYVARAKHRDVAVLPPGDEVASSARQAWLVVEVAETSLARDRGVKSRLYAAAGTGEYWIVNLVDDVIEVHREPGPEGYALTKRHAPGDSLCVAGFSDVVVRVEDVLPPGR
jgi:hypothetical protein